MPRSRRWTATVNNYTMDELKIWKEMKVQDQACPIQYLLFGQEVGALRGTPHLQGYFETRTKVSLSTIKGWPGFHRAHLEVAKGTAAQNKVYCHKEGREHYELGEPMRQGRRSDLEDVKQDVDNGAQEVDLWRSHFNVMVRYHQAIARYRTLISQPRNWETEVIVMIGPTGVGKTRYVMEMVMERRSSLWTYSSGGWYDGYQGQEIALFDDFYGEESGIKWDMLLKLLDRYPMQVPVKGSFVNWCPRTIVITSNVGPTEWYPRVINQDALWRRVTTLMDNNFWE